MAKEKTNGDGSDSSGEEHGTVRKHRHSVSQQKPTTFQVQEPNESSPQREIATEKHDLVEVDEEDIGIRRAMFIRMIGSALIVVTIILTVVVIYLATKPIPVPYCNYRDKDYVTPRDYKTPDVFDDLTPGEYKTAKNFLMGNLKYNIKEITDARVNSSYIYMIQVFMPDKEDVIQYLDRGRSKPPRMAKAIMVRGDTKVPAVEEYLIYPLPNPTTVELYQDPSFRRQPIPYTSRPVDTVEYKYLYDTIVTTASEQMYPLLMTSYGLCYHNCTKGKNCMLVFDVAPRAYKSGERKSWFWFFPDVEGFYIFPLGLEMLVDHKSTNIDDWRLEKIVYNGQGFDSVDNLMLDFRSNKLKIIHEHDHTEQPPYSAYKSKRSYPNKPTQGPMFYEPEGKRFTVNGQTVKYNKWEFSFQMHPFIGMQIFNAKFDGSRIAYELGLQEVLVLYSGYGPVQSSTNYYDSGWMLGAVCMELVRGIDCPETAVFLDTYMMGTKSKNSICIFENNGAIPLRRHYANNFEGGYSFYGGLTDYHIVIRTVANLWNYDYVFDYVFYNNGAIESKASATGYVQATFGLPGEKNYGSSLRDHVIADLHLHIFNYKVDLDIAGQKNRYSTLDIGLAPFKDPWIKGVDRQKAMITEVLHKKESKDSTNDPNVLQYHLIQSAEAKNKFGAKRSYRILNKSPIVNIMSQLGVTNASRWTKYPIIVTQRKDAERHSTSVYAQNDPWNPVLDFDDFIDDESLVDEDLVAWVTMGTHHIPGTEDVPSTPTTWNQFSFFLTPHNYFDECPSRDSTDTVIIRPGKDKKAKVESFGRSYKGSCIQKNKGPFEFDGFRR